MQRREEERSDRARQGADRVPPGQRDGKQPYAAEIEDYSGEAVAPPVAEKPDRDRGRDSPPAAPRRER
jgi:hypothetical protein